MSNDDPNKQPDIQYGYQGGMQGSVQPNVSFGGGLAAAGPAPVVKDISTAEFATEVIEASKQTPVIIDFWAPWCEPCKQLAPVLEKVVAEANGSVKLVKMNIDEHPEVAGQMGVQSIPAVVAFRDGRPAEAFMGAKPESEIRRFVEKVGGATGPSEVDMAIEQAEQLKAAGEIDQALQIYSAILQQLPDNLAAIIGAGTIFLENDDLDKAKEMLARIAEERLNEQDVVSFSAAIDLAEQADEVGELGELMSAVEQDEKNHQARFDLAIALNGRNKREEAAEHLLHIIKTDRAWNDDGAKTQLLQFFEAWGLTDEVTVEARRKLSSVLFS